MFCSYFVSYYSTWLQYTIRYAFKSCFTLVSISFSFILRAKFRLFILSVQIEADAFYEIKFEFKQTS